MLERPMRYPTRFSPFQFHQRVEYGLHFPAKSMFLASEYRSRLVWLPDITTSATHFIYLDGTPYRIDKSQPLPLVLGILVANRLSCTDKSSDSPLNCQS